MLPHGQRFNEELMHEIVRKDIGFEIRQYDEWKEHKSTNHRAIKQDRNNGIVDNSLLLEDVVKAQQYG